MLRKLIWAAAAVAFAGCGGPDAPEQGALGAGDAAPDPQDGTSDGVLETGEYLIHHRAVLTRALAPEVRQSYGFPETSDEVLLIVSVERSESRDSVGAAIEAEAVNLSGQRVDVGMREVQANDMTSYIGLVEVEDREVLDFTVRVLPQGASEPIDFEFRQRFFTEPPAAAGTEEPLVADVRRLPNLRALDVDRRKAGFFRFLLPIVADVNGEVRGDKQRLRAAAGRVERGAGLSAPTERWLRRLGRAYGVAVARGEPGAETIAALRARVDVVPAPLVLAQAAKESGWGTSRFAVEANNLFGQRCYSAGCGLVPKELEDGAGFAVARYGSVRESVASYVRNLNTHPRYDLFRDLRRELRASGTRLESLLLVEGLRAYSERGRRYVAEVKVLIRQNREALGRLTARRYQSAGSGGGTGSSTRSGAI